MSEQQSDKNSETPRVNRMLYVGMLRQNDGSYTEGGEWVRADDARQIERELAGVIAERDWIARERAREKATFDKPSPSATLRRLADEFPEVNPGNYDEEDVRRINDWGIEVVQALRSLPSESVVSEDIPLRCKAEAGVLDMRIGVKVLAFAVEHCPDLWDAESNKGRYKVTDPATFAKEVELVLNHESEDGSTRFTRMLDDAVLEAIAQGAEGVEEVVATDRHGGNDK